MVMGDTQHYINVFAFVTSSIGLLGAKPVESIIYAFRYPLHWNYYNYQPYSRNAYPTEVFYPYIILPQDITRNCVGCPPFIVQDNKRNLPAKSTGSHASLVRPSKKSAASTEKTGSSRNELEADTEKGFKLINDLVEIISQAAGTASDSDLEEVNAIKSIFSDIIDEVIRQIKPSFKENNLDPTISDAFIHISETTRKGIAEAPNQTILTAILKPYVTILQELAFKGLQTTAP